MNIRPSRIDHVQKGTVAGGSEMRWCGEHDVPYVGTCPVHDEEAKDAATYRRGLIDGLREAAQTVCKTFCTPELPIAWSGDYAAFVHIGALRSDVRCVANRVYKRISELTAQTEVTA